MTWAPGDSHGAPQHGHPGPAPATNHSEHAPATWWPDILAAAITFLSIAAYPAPRIAPDFFGGLLVTLIMAAAVLIARRFPGIALVLVWLACGLQILASDVQLAQLAIPWVAYATSRYGTRLVQWAAAASIPFGIVIALVWVTNFYSPLLATVLPPIRALPTALRAVTMISMVVAFLGLPWAFGLVARARARGAQAEQREEGAHRARREAEAAWYRAQQDAARATEEQARAQRLAALEAEQARLARDVHDVVGHSLAVILAQAQSAEFLDDPERLQQTLENIAASARTSLTDVRQVLGQLRHGGPSVAQPGASPSSGMGAPGQLEDVIATLRTAAPDVRASVTGTPRPLPPELATVAYRVLQEMTTNALRHGDVSQPIVVEQSWADALVLRVRNVVRGPGDSTTTALAGTGISGMRARLASVGGGFELQTHPAEAGDVVSATAWIPLRATYPEETP
ncbi:MAG: histidine kinase [bacterium]|nr:histidine kinase [bacterium]